MSGATTATPSCVRPVRSRCPDSAAAAYEKVRVTVIVRAKPKPGFEDRWKPNTWRKSWILR